MPHTLQLPFRDAMAACASGVHVITTDGTAGRYGITMTAVTAVTDEPPTVMLCINRQSAIVPVLLENRAVCINVLAAGQQDVAEHFAGMTKLSRRTFRIPHLAQGTQRPASSRRRAGTPARQPHHTKRSRHPLGIHGGNRRNHRPRRQNNPRPRTGLFQTAFRQPGLTAAIPASKAV